MKQIGRRIYYELTTGNRILDTGERQGFVIPTTIEQDMETFTALSERNRDTFEYIELDYGQYAQDFAQCNGYRVNPETLELEFSYPDPNVPVEEQVPVYRPPLSEQLTELQQENELLQESVMEMTTYVAQQDERLQLQEQAMLELTTLIAGGNA